MSEHFVYFVLNKNNSVESTAKLMIENNDLLEELKNKTFEKLKKYAETSSSNILYMIKQERINNIEIENYLREFKEKNNDSLRFKIIENLLFSVTKANEIPKNCYIEKFNVKHLFVLEVLDSLLFISFPFCSKNINSTIIENEFENLKLDIYIKLIQELQRERREQTKERMINELLEIKSIQSILNTSTEEFVSLT